METDNIKIQYFKQQLERGIKRVYEAQRAIVTSQVAYNGSTKVPLQRSGLLLSSLTTPRYSMNNVGAGVVSTSNVPMYIRFLDMKRKGNYEIYNRQIWGILYCDTIHSIQSDYQNWIIDNFPDMLKKAGGDISKLM